MSMWRCVMVSVAAIGAVLTLAPGCDDGAAGRSTGVMTSGTGGDAGAAGIGAGGAGGGDTADAAVGTDVADAAIDQVEGDGSNGGGGAGGFGPDGGDSGLFDGGTPCIVQDFQPVGCEQPDQYCQYGVLNGFVAVNRCVPYPTGCHTCGCALEQYQQAVQMTAICCYFAHNPCFEDGQGHLVVLCTCA